MKQNKPSQIRTSTSSALPPLHQEWALGSWSELSNRPWEKGSVPSERPLSVGTGWTPCACVLCRGVTGGQTFRGWIVHTQWDPRDVVLERLLPGRIHPFQYVPSPQWKEIICSWKIYIKLTCFGCSQRPLPVFVLCKVMVKESQCFARWSWTMGGLLGIFDLFHHEPAKPCDTN